MPDLAIGKQWARAHFETVFCFVDSVNRSTMTLLDGHNPRPYQLLPASA